MNFNVLTVSPGQSLHVDLHVLFLAGWLLFEIVLAASSVTSVCVIRAFVLGGIGKPQEALGKVAAVECSETGCAGADDAQLELDDGPHADVEACPAHVGGFGYLGEVVCPSYAGTGDATTY